MDDHCIVCAEPLNFTAYGVCGHKDTCSKCVVRLRTVLKDKRCVYCQQQLPEVFVTRFIGDYTVQLTAQDFDKLMVRSCGGCGVKRKMKNIPELSPHNSVLQ